MTPLLSSSRPQDSRKHTGVSALRDVHSEALYLLLPELTPTLSSLIPWGHIPLLTPPSWSLIPKARHRDAAASIVVPEYPIPQTHGIFLVLRQHPRCRRQLCGPGSERLLTFGLLTLYLFWRQFVPMTVGRSCLPKLGEDGTVENS